jgi:hypothetical protein
MRRRAFLKAAALTLAAALNLPLPDFKKKVRKPFEALNGGADFDKKLYLQEWVKREAECIARRIDRDILTEFLSQSLWTFSTGWPTTWSEEQ